MVTAAQSELRDLLEILRQRLDGSDTEADALEIERESERHLSALRDALKKLGTQGKNDIFVRYLLERLASISRIATEAATKSVLRVSEHQFTCAQDLLEAFGAGERIMRYTWRIDTSEPLFGDTHWLRHFELTSSLAIAGSLEMRAILILEDQSQISSDNIKNLLEFFASQEGVSAKIVGARDYELSAMDFAIPSTCVEFGIYGDALLYEAKTYVPVSVGCWSKDSMEIARYRRFFDVVWNTVAAKNPASAEKKMRLSQLIAADQAHPAAAASRQASNGVHQTIDSIEELLNSDAA